MRDTDTMISDLEALRDKHNNQKATIAKIKAELLAMESFYFLDDIESALDEIKRERHDIESALDEIKRERC